MERALRLQRLKVSDREDPFAAIIRCTADPVKADKRSRSKRSRVMRYVAAYKPDSKPLGQFIRGKGGINACASRFSRYLGSFPSPLMRRHNHTVQRPVRMLISQAPLASANRVEAPVCWQATGS
jgi:hypothetical protein